MSNSDAQSQANGWLISHLRWLWLVLALVVALLTATPPWSENMGVFYALLGVGVLYNTLMVGLLALGWYPKWVGTMGAAIDTILATLMMWFTGGFASAQLPTLLFVVLIIALFFSAEGGLLAAMSMGLTYAASVILWNATALENLIDISVKSLTLFLAAGLVGAITHQRVQRAAHEEKAEIQRLKAANERAKAIYEMANTLSSTLNYRKVLKAMIDVAYIALTEADTEQSEASRQINSGAVGLVLMFDDERAIDKLRMVAGRNVPRMDEDRQISVAGGVLQEVIFKAETVIINNMQDDPGLMKFSALQKCHSMVCSPLRAGFTSYGLVLFAHPQPNFYTSVHASFLATFCNQAIIALQNAQLYEDLEMEQKKLLEKEAQARRELARNLHDGPTQEVSGIAMRLNFARKLLERKGDIPKALDEIIKLEDVARKTTQNLRTMLFTLRPVVLETQGLTAALDQYATRLRDLEGMDVEIDERGYNGQLSTEAEGVIFTIIEEAVNNVKKYAKAELTRVKLDVHNDLLIAEVIDNGVGFDVASVKASYDTRGSLGLLNMNERAQMIGGRCNIVSAQGQGTNVRIEVPLQAEPGGGNAFA